MSNEPSKPPRGRPRSASVDKALVEAARDEFVTKGFHAMSMESIANRADVSKVSLYRRWPSKLEAAADALRLLSESGVPEDHGSLEADIRALFAATIHSEGARARARFLMRTMGEISDHPDLLAIYRTQLLAPRIEQIRTVIGRARARKEVSDIPTDVAAMVVAGPLFLHSLFLLADPDRAWPGDLVETLTRTVLLGIGAPPPHPAPAR
ncbi:MAG: TetR/AcrR family transcriptional regulator [Azospirillaceae bacterium]|nr:TetR/AcrR family transcriptional regulator [Azospirillaceae bacterium]